MEDALSDLTLVQRAGTLAVAKNRYQLRWYVIRLNAKGEAIVRLSTHRNEKTARAWANDIWRQDRQRQS